MKAVVSPTVPLLEGAEVEVEATGRSVPMKSDE